MGRTTARKAITLATKVAVLQDQAICGCGCGASLAGEDIQWDHVLAYALKGSDGPENIRAVLEDCHTQITNGTKATTAGSTKNVVAKSKRIQKKNEGRAGASSAESPSEPPKARAGGSPKRKIQSCGFQPPLENYKHNWPSQKIPSRPLRGRGA